MVLAKFLEPQEDCDGTGSFTGITKVFNTAIALDTLFELLRE